MSIARSCSTLVRGVALGILFWHLGPCLASAQPASDGGHAYLLDTPGKALVTIDLQSGSVMARTPLDDAEELIGTGDGKRLVTIGHGAHKSTFCCGYQPKAPMTATVLDAATLVRSGRVEVGWGMPTRVFASGFELLADKAAPLTSLDGQRASFLCTGYRNAKKPEENLPREIVTIELATGRVLGRVALDREMELLGRVGATETAVLYARFMSGKEPLPAEVVFVDLAAQTVAERVTLAEGNPGRPFLAGDGWLYLLDPGSPSKKKEKNVDGRITVVNLTERRLAGTLNAGSDPKAFVWDDARQQTLLASDGPPVEKGESRRGELRVLKGAEIVATIPLPEEPHLVRVLDARAYVACRGALAVVALDELRAAGEVLVEHASGVDEIVFSPDRKKAVALFDASSKLEILDLDPLRLVGSVTTGRGGVKFAKALGAAALSAAATAASYYQGMTVAQTQHRSYFTYNVYNFGVAAAETGVVVRPDGKFAYALNTQTNDVTVVDTATATVVTKEAAKGRALAALTGGAKLAVLGGDELRLFDTLTNKPTEPLAFEDANGVQLLFSADGETAIAYGGKACYVLDGRTGAVRARVGGLLGVRAVRLGEATAAAEAAAAPPSETTVAPSEPAPAAVAVPAAPPSQ